MDEAEKRRQIELAYEELQQQWEEEYDASNCEEEEMSDDYSYINYDDVEDDVDERLKHVSIDPIIDRLSRSQILELIKEYDDIGYGPIQKYNERTSLEILKKIVCEQMERAKDLGIDFDLPEDTSSGRHPNTPPFLYDFSGDDLSLDPRMW